MLAGNKELTGQDDVLAPLLNDQLDAALSGELQAHVEKNRPNRLAHRCGIRGKTKTVKTGHEPLN